MYNINICLKSTKSNITQILNNDTTEVIMFNPNVQKRYQEISTPFELMLFMDLDALIYKVTIF